jgi:dTDP-L-rhamnose 4-epimerase
MSPLILITGGAGFIGSHLADELLRHDYRVRALDSLVPEVNGAAERPAYLDPEVELVLGDVRDPEAVEVALQGADGVVHLAARLGVGVGVDRSSATEFIDVNVGGTAVLLEGLAKRPVDRLVLASSMRIYGEGLYAAENGRTYSHVVRRPEELGRKSWDPLGTGGERLRPRPTPETKPAAVGSTYALSKYAAEQLGLMIGPANGVSTVALRIFNAYGPRQGLSNPYSGVMTLFASRLSNGQPPLVFEDGLQRRDFVHARDVARACRLALEAPRAANEVLNIGSGRPITILDLGRRMARAIGKAVEPEVTSSHRLGDVRHCFPDVTRADKVLGFRATEELDAGLLELAEWLARHNAAARPGPARSRATPRRLSV